MGLVLLLANQQGAAKVKAGRGVLTGAPVGSSAVVYVESGTGRATMSASGTRSATGTAAGLYPQIGYQVAFASQPLSIAPAWNDLSTRVRGLRSVRGRSYEFDRMETGTLGANLSNRDAALSPANSSSPYAPVKSTRPVRAFAQWVETYPIFQGITQGFPQAFPNLGKDALVTLNAADAFYALNQVKLAPGSTFLGGTLGASEPSAEETMFVRNTQLPMPQAVPFAVTIDAGTGAEEEVTVTAILSNTSYRVVRGSEPVPHVTLAPVTTQVVSFGQELSGTRIRNVLTRAGFEASWLDLDAGQSIMAPSEDLVSVNPLEHINLIAEAEFGRFFVSREGKFTFRDRHSTYLDFLTPVATFRDLPVSGSEIPYRIDGALEHSEDKLYNRVKITIPSGLVVDILDQDSIDQHFERTFEREWPYADANDAYAAAQFILGRAVEHSLRLPRLTVHPASNPTVLWPLVLAREIGERVRFRYQPEAGGTEIDEEMVVEGIAHEIAPRDYSVSFQLTETDPNDYWILGTTGYSELGETTWAGF